MTFGGVGIDQDGIGGIDFVAAADRIAGRDFQRIKLVNGSEDGTEEIPGDDVGGLWVNVKALEPGTAVQLTDGTDTADILALASANALPVAVVDGNGDQITAFSGSGGTSAIDDADYTRGSSAFTPVGGVYESSEGSITDGDMAMAALDQKGRMKVNVAAITATVTGASVYRSLDLDESEEEVKATAGVVYGFWVANLATSTRFVKFYNATAASVTVGSTTPMLTVPVPGNSSDDVGGVFGVPGPGLAFGTAITIAATTGVADADSGAPSANDVVINVFYE